METGFDVMLAKGTPPIDRTQQDRLEAREGVQQETSPRSPVNTSPNWAITMECGEAQCIKTSSLSLRVMVVFGGEVWSEGTHDQGRECLEEHEVSIPQNK